MCGRVCGWWGQRRDSSTAGWRTGGTRSVLTTVLDLSNVLAQECVEGVVTGQWKYTDGRSWQVDAELTVLCLDTPEPEPECVYSDQTEFQVLNLLL